MGVVNATPDSFYQAGRSESHDAARDRVDQLCAEGAEIADIGGESSRPGAAQVSATEQIARIEPAVAYAVASRKLLVSVDTTNAAVAEHMLAIGAVLVNDVSCLADADLARVTARAGATLVLMHTRGALGSMPGDWFHHVPEHPTPRADVASLCGGLRLWQVEQYRLTAAEQSERGQRERSGPAENPGCHTAHSL